MRLFSSLSILPFLNGLIQAVKFGGTNIAGFDFGQTSDGYYTPNTAGIDLVQSGAALGQMQHFVSEGLNTFQLPVPWQFLASSPSVLNETAWKLYDGLVQACLDAGAILCLIDLHSYARWNGQVIGQGGPTDAEFASFWAQLAGKYSGNQAVGFNIMNEPHDLDINTWATTSQAVVNSIRAENAENWVLIEGNSYASAGAFTSESGSAMMTVKNPDGGYSALAFSVHQYFDADFSGQTAECVYNGNGIFQKLGDWLRQNQRYAFVTEIGGGNGSDCLVAICGTFDIINAYSDVYAGVTTWSAGAFGSSYPLVETPTWTGSGWIDQPLVSNCVIPKLGHH